MVSACGSSGEPSFDRLCPVYGTRSSNGFTLIEIMIVVAIVGILAALAVPNYLEYVTRSKSVEIITYAASFKPDITAYVAAYGVMPTLAEIDNPTPLIRRIEFWRPRDDRLVIHMYPTTEYWSGIDENVDAILLEATLPEKTAVQWKCGPHAAFRHVPEKFLPLTCREWIDDQP